MEKMTVIAVAARPMMRGLHSRPQHAGIEMGKMTVIGTLMGHLMFGIIVALVYSAPADSLATQNRA